MQILHHLHAVRRHLIDHGSEGLPADIHVADRLSDLELAVDLGVGFLHAFASSLVTWPDLEAEDEPLYEILIFEGREQVVQVVHVVRLPQAEGEDAAEAVDRDQVNFNAVKAVIEAPTPVRT